MTQLLYEHADSLGSRLHRSDSGEPNTFIAYAQWPSRDVLDAANDKLPAEAEAARERMHESCTEIKTLHELEVEADLLR